MEILEPPSGFIDYPPGALLRVTGEDALDFLQGQFTQELRPEKAPEVAYGLWLNQKGRVIADSHVLRAGEGQWWLFSATSPAATIRDRLEAYVIADDVVIEDLTPAWKERAVFGGEGEEWLRARCGGVLPSVGALARVGEAFVFRGRRGRDDAWEWLTPLELPEATGMTALSSGEADAWRVLAGIPAIPGEVGPDDLPNEAGLDEMAISYTKGCYLGQEVMARLKSMGRIRRRILRVAAKEPVSVRVPAPLFQAARKVGELRAVAPSPRGGCAGLAMCTLLGLVPDQPLALAPDGDGVFALLDQP